MNCRAGLSIQILEWRGPPPPIGGAGLAIQILVWEGDQREMNGG